MAGDRDYFVSTSSRGDSLIDLAGIPKAEEKKAIALIMQVCDNINRGDGGR